MTGHLLVAPDQRDAYLADCAQVVTLARHSPGCLDFALGADLVDPGRINILERWATREELDAFRGSGPSEDQQTAILDADVQELEVG